ncbi:MAG: ABC transporter permease [Candidatus Bathyarchaeia archaeon]
MKRETPDQAEMSVFREDVRIFKDVLRRNILYPIGLFVVLAFLIYSAVFALIPDLINYNPSSINLNAILQPPSVAFPFGTDDLGRNLFLKVLNGIPIDAGISLAVVLLALTIGLLTGAMAGYFGGVINQAIMGVTDIFLAFPGLVLAVAFAAALGAGTFNVIIALAIVWWPVYTRLARGETLTVKEQQYVMAARASGLNGVKIVLSHIMPNVLTPMIAYATADIGNVILLSAVLGYLGLGAQPPNVDLGRIVYDGQNFVRFAPWYSILPGIVLFIIAISFAFVGDLLRDFLDPKMRV